MNRLQQQLHFPCGDTLPAPGDALEVAPGVRWVRMPLPFALDHVNLWLLRDRLDGREGWAIVDCGIDDAATRAAWERVFETRLDGLPVLRVVATHMHPDHLGLAHWLTERWGCGLWISSTDWLAARLAVQSTLGHGGVSAAEHFARHGLRDPEAQRKVRARGSYYASMVPAVPARHHRLMDGAHVRIGGREWRCIAGFGHAPEHIALHQPEAGVLISGDMVLPRISTNVGVTDGEPEADPLRLYLASLERLAVLPPDPLVLPSHGRPFRGLHRRIDALAGHHLQQLDLLQDFYREPRTANDALPVMFGRALRGIHRMLALGEALAHLHYLRAEGRVERLEEDGVYRFVRV
jgi:glyoxylase-like metal-dependent hydrolase (beta-lactamase superfamily II)